MISFPPCKINLGLLVISKRPDGFHNIATCFYPVPWTDILEIIPAEKFSFSTSGNVIPGGGEENLCTKAYKLLQQDFNLPPVSIHLHKSIPIGAGLGGGSSDGAFTLRLLNNIFQLELSQDLLVEYASRLGSDCAFFLHDAPMLGSGRGEILSPVSLNLSGKYLVIVKPDIHVSTAEAYGGIIPKEPLHSLSEIVKNYSIEEWRNLLRNDFEESVFRKYPELQKIKEKLYGAGAIYASMSGSGSSVFGIFNSDQNVKDHFNTMTCWSGKL